MGVRLCLPPGLPPRPPRSGEWLVWFERLCVGGEAHKLRHEYVAGPKDLHNSAVCSVLKTLGDHWEWSPCTASRRPWGELAYAGRRCTCTSTSTSSMRRTRFRRCDRRTETVWSDALRRKKIPRPLSILPSSISFWSGSLRT